MVEPVLYFVLGFLAASLAALAFLRAVWGRAVRLTITRLAARLPTSPAMIAADRDHLRAAHAIETRKLERRVETLGSEAVGYRAAAARDRLELRRVTEDLQEARTRLGAAEAREAAATAALAQVTREVGDRRGRPPDTRALVGADLDRDSLRAEYAALSVEKAALEAEIAARRGTEDQLRKEIARLVAGNAERAARAEGRSEGAAAEPRADATATAGEIAALEQTLAGVRAEKLELESALERAGAEKAALQARVDDLERAIAEGESEDNQLLRNRLNALAADIARWTATAPPAAPAPEPAAAAAVETLEPAGPRRSLG
jgi:chromosome segregation ATPase